MGNCSVHSWDLQIRSGRTSKKRREPPIMFDPCPGLLEYGVMYESGPTRRTERWTFLLRPLLPLESKGRHRDVQATGVAAGFLNLRQWLNTVNRIQRRPHGLADHQLLPRLL